MSIFKSFGLKSYESNPVWVVADINEVVSIDLNEFANISVSEGEFGYSLREQAEDGTVRYVPLKRGVLESKTTYRVALHVASRDWANDDGEGAIVKGEEKSLAY